MMKKLTEIFQQQRQNLSIALSKVSQDTKIPQKQLLNIELGNWTGFNSYAYLQGVVKKYASYLGLDPGKIGSYLKREVDESKVEFIRQTDYQDSTKPISVNWSIYLLVLLVVSFFSLQLFLSWQKPLLKVSTIPALIKVNESLIVKGQTEPGVLLYLNDEPIYQDDKGRFSERLYFKVTGERQIQIKAIGVNGKEQVLNYSVKIVKN